MNYPFVRDSYQFIAISRLGFQFLGLTGIWSTPEAAHHRPLMAAPTSVLWWNKILLGYKEGIVEGSHQDLPGVWQVLWSGGM